MPDIFYSDRAIDRHSALRNDPAELERALGDSTTRFVAIWQGKCLIRGDRIALLTLEYVSTYTRNPESRSFLGRLNDRFIFAIAIDSADEPDFGADAGFVSLRRISSSLCADDAGLAAFAKAIVAWQNHHRYCSVCGSPNCVEEGGFVMACTDHECAHRSFPRLDPAVIVLVYNNDLALLGRQAKWPEQRFSTIAGFVEPGESLEDAIRREVAEETNILVGETMYIASQPWPFPAALMIGFHAQGLSEDIVLNDDELAEARWVSRQDIISGEVVLPPKISVAYHLIETWFDQHDGPTLAELGLPDAPLHVTRP
jgi:NAD+ diphosphatase